MAIVRQMGHACSGGQITNVKAPVLVQGEIKLDWMCQGLSHATHVDNAGQMTYFLHSVNATHLHRNLTPADRFLKIQIQFL